MKKAFVISAVALFCAGALGAVAITTHKSAPQKLESSLVAYGTLQDPDTDDEGNVIDNTPSQPKPIDLVAVVDPFSGNMNTPITFTSLDASSVDAIAGVTDNQVSDREVILPNDFSKLGVNYAVMPETKNIIVMQRMHFIAASQVRWDNQPDASGQYSWSDHPDYIDMTSGQTLIVTYKSEDYGQTWKGSVQL